MCLRGLIKLVRKCLAMNLPEEIIGTKVKDIYGDPDDRRKLVELLEKDGICRHFESFCKRKIGAHFYIEREYKVESWPHESKPETVLPVMQKEQN